MEVLNAEGWLQSNKLSQFTLSVINLRDWIETNFNFNGMQAIILEINRETINRVAHLTMALSGTLVFLSFRWLPPHDMSLWPIGSQQIHTLSTHCKIDSHSL